MCDSRGSGGNRRAGRAKPDTIKSSGIPTHSLVFLIRRATHQSACLFIAFVDVLRIDLSPEAWSINGINRWRVEFVAKDNILSFAYHDYIRCFVVILHD